MSIRRQERFAHVNVKQCQRSTIYESCIAVTGATVTLPVQIGYAILLIHPFCQAWEAHIEYRCIPTSHMNMTQTIEINEAFAQIKQLKHNELSTVSTYHCPWIAFLISEVQDCSHLFVRAYVYAKLAILSRCSCSYDHLFDHYNRGVLPKRKCS